MPGLVDFEISKPTSSDTPSNLPRRSHLLISPNTVPAARDLAFKYTGLRGPFSFTPPSEFLSYSTVREALLSYYFPRLTWTPGFSRHGLCSPVSLSLACLSLRLPRQPLPAAHTGSSTQLYTRPPTTKQ